MGGPGIARVDSRFDLNYNEPIGSGSFAIPVPLAFEDQVPLTFSLSVTPTAALENVQWVQRNPHDWVVEVTVNSAAAERIEVAWHSYVLIREHNYSGLPAEALVVEAEQLPAEVRPWLQSTGCVQVDDRDVQSVATELYQDGNLIGIARSAAPIPYQMAEQALEEGLTFSSLDAVEALHNGGSCTSAANLAAALLRANGVPARVLAVYPTDGHPLQTHYLIEFYVQGYGWVWMESTLGRFPWAPTNAVVVSVVYPEDEDRALESAGRWAMPGVPWASLTENLSGEGWFAVGTLAQYCDHMASEFQVFADTTRLEEAFELANQVWAADVEARAGGTASPEAQAFQLAAAQSETLEDLVEQLQNAERVYGPD
jgi:hypothetical protein